MEIWVSVIDVPPSKVGVVEEKIPGISLCLMNAVRPMTNSRNPVTGATRSSGRQAVDGDSAGVEILDRSLQ